jgi:signal transduction histidine kinase
MNSYVLLFNTLVISLGACEGGRSNSKVRITSTRVGSNLKTLKQLFWVWALLGLSFLSVHASEHNSMELSYFQDDSQKLHVEQLDIEKFSPLPAGFALGFTHATTWIRIKTHINPESGQYFLSVWPPRLENLALFAQKSGDMEFTQILARPESKRMHNVFYDSFKRNVFDLHEFRDTNFFYLKIVSDNALTGGISLLTSENIDAHRANEGFLLGGVVFGLVPFLLIFLALAIYKRQTLYLVYSLSLLTTTFLYLSVYGFDWVAVLFKKDISLDHQVGVMGIINIYFSYTFLSYICNLLGAPYHITNKMRFFLMGCLVFLPFYIWFDKQTALGLFYALIVLLSMLILFCIVCYANKKSFLQWLIAILFASITIGAAKVLLTMLGIVHTSDNVFVSQTLRILTIPFALLVLVGYFELENNRFVLKLQLERALAEQHKKTESERRKIYDSFISMLVHEIKTPLSVIQIAASSLSRHLESNTAEINRINNIKKAVTDINQIFNKCIQVVDLENGSVSLEPSEFSLDYLSEDLIKTFGFDRFECKKPDRVKLNTDFVLLRTILVNLISNGLKYGKSDSVVVLKIVRDTSPDGARTTFTVTNTVGEVGAPDADKLFNRYYRSESAKKFTGSGLGLWLSQGLASILGGEIIMTTHDDIVCFQLTLFETK